MDMTTQSSVLTLDLGIRIKATEGDTGSTTGVTYSEITLESISEYVIYPYHPIIHYRTVLTQLKQSYGIIIEQNYDGGDLDGGTPTSGIPITDLTIENVSGVDAVDSSGYNIVIVCGSSGCSDWTWDDVDVTGGEDYPDCENVPTGISCS